MSCGNREGDVGECLTRQQQRRQQPKLQLQQIYQDQVDRLRGSWGSGVEQPWPSATTLQGSTATAFLDTAPGSFERPRNNEPLSTPIPLIRAVDPPDAGVVAVAVSAEQEMIRLRSVMLAQFPIKGVSFTPDPIDLFVSD
jgi:hypothetical protein